jgi:hypothetical protein
MEGFDLLTFIRNLFVQPFDFPFELVRNIEIVGSTRQLSREFIDVEFSLFRPFSNPFFSHKILNILQTSDLISSQLFHHIPLEDAGSVCLCLRMGQNRIRDRIYRLVVALKNTSSQFFSIYVIRFLLDPGFFQGISSKPPAIWKVRMSDASTQSLSESSTYLGRTFAFKYVGK